MNAGNLNRELKKSLNQIARNLFDKAVGEVSLEELVEAALQHEYLKQLDGEIIKEAAVRSAIEREHKDRTRSVSPEYDAPNKTLALFSGEWEEHGMSYEGKFVKNRHASRKHNINRMQNVEENAERVEHSRDTERERFALLEIAYNSDTSIQTNEEAKAWLVSHEYELPFA